MSIKISFNMNLLNKYIIIVLNINKELKLFSLSGLAFLPKKI